MKKTRFLSLLGTASLGASMLLTACGGADPTTTAVPATAAPVVAPTVAATAATGGAMTPTTAMGGAMTPTAAMGGATTPAAGATEVMTNTGPPTSTPKPGAKVLRINISSEPDQVDPQKGSFVGEIGWIHMAYEGLLELDKDNKPVPAAADGMPTVSPDGLTYTVKVRQGLKYSDGKPLGAKDFYYGWTRLLDPALPDRNYAYIAYDIKGAQDLSEAPVTDTAKIATAKTALGIKLQDANTIVFTLSSPVAYFNDILATWIGMPVREDLVKAAGDTWTQDPKNYIGNGPFILREWTHGSGAVWESNPNYRKGQPKIDRIEFREIKESAQAFAAYKQGELDTAAVAPEDLKAVSADATLKTQYARTPGNCSFYLGFNLKKPPFDNLKVRQAFALALDKNDWVEVILKGAGTVSNSFVPPGRPGYEKDLNQGDFDATAAKKLLADAGFPEGKGLPPIKITYSSTARNKSRNEWIQNQIKTNLGIDAQLDPVDAKEYTKLTKKNETLPQIYVLGWCQDYPDPQDWLSLVFRSDVAITPQGWKNAQYDDLTKKADVEQDPTKRLALYKQAQQILITETPAVFIWSDVTDQLIKPYITGMRDNVSASDELIPGFKNIENIDIKK